MHPRRTKVRALFSLCSDVLTADGEVSTLAGTVFKVTRDGALRTLVSFDGTNGLRPTTALLQGSDENFYGTTVAGGTRDLGTVFKMTPDGALTTLYLFNGPDGANPGLDLGSTQPGMIQGKDGNFYGTTEFGGAFGDPPSERGVIGYGTVFNITPGGALTRLASFDGTNGVALSPV